MRLLQVSPSMVRKDDNVVFDYANESQKNVNLLELFFSIDGETKRAGELVWFIRLAGCNLRCIYCDTVYSQKAKGNSQTINNIINEIETKNNCKKITVTGGEPLIHQNINALVCCLAYKGFDINIETNGSVSPKNILDFSIIQKQGGSLWFSFDYKTSGSGMKNQMLSTQEIADVLSNSCIKFVVSCQNDLLESVERIIEMEAFYAASKSPNNNRPQYYFSPCFGKIKPLQIVEFMKEQKLYDRVRLQIQLHKVIWNPNMREV